MYFPYSLQHSLHQTEACMDKPMADSRWCLVEINTMMLLFRLPVMSNSVTPWTAARQASLSLTISRSLPKFMSIASVIPSSHLILWYPLLLLPSIFPSIRNFPNQLTVCIRWPKYWSFSFSISSSNEYSGLISLNIDWFDLPAVQGLSGVFSRTTAQKHQFSGFLPSFWSSSHNHTWPLGRPQPWLYEHL